jgi:hypothetical protein
MASHLEGPSLVRRSELPGGSIFVEALWSIRREYRQVNEPYDVRRRV